EEYHCTGNLEQDFTELCSRLGMTEIPVFIARPRHPVAVQLEKSLGVLERVGHPSIMVSRGQFTYFRPSIQTDVENDDGKAVKEIFIRGWKIDEKMMGIFNKCLPAVVNLHTINLWNVGLTESTMVTFLAILPHCANLKTVVLDGNPIPQELYHKLIGEESMLTHVSLRNNKIDDHGAKLIGNALSTLKTANKVLISLNLSYNHISDQGAGDIAQGLRLNRSLLCLSLAHNHIGDQGAVKLAEVLGPFALMHEEVVERRSLQLEKSMENPRSPPFSRLAELKTDRPHSHSSIVFSEKPDKAVKTNKSASKKKEKAGSLETSKKDEKSGASGGGGQGAATGKKEDGSKLTKKPVSVADVKGSRGKGTKSGNKEKRFQVLEVELVAELTGTLSPLLEQADHRDGKVFLPGNHVLVNLNLMRNNITEVGLKAFLVAIQSMPEKKQGVPATNKTGLLRLSLAGGGIQSNNFPPDCETFQKIQELMHSRDPLYKNTHKSEEEQA
uniref:Leucine rich repeat containing 71 n=1 Tax=Latimeria chalumnae TaxID=7897 RepID=H3AWB4_LATCH